MDMNPESNYLQLCGTLAGAPVWSHSSRGVEFWRFPLSVRRLSGTADLLNVVARRRLLDTLAPLSAGKLQLTGELRSFNNRSGSGAKLVISAFARELRFCEDGDANRLFLRGTLCKPPNLRQTPLGRDICDLMLSRRSFENPSDFRRSLSFSVIFALSCVAAS